MLSRRLELSAIFDDEPPETPEEHIPGILSAIQRRVHNLTSEFRRAGIEANIFSVEEHTSQEGYWYADEAATYGCQYVEEDDLPQPDTTLGPTLEHEMDTARKWLEEIASIADANWTVLATQE